MKWKRFARIGFLLFAVIPILAFSTLAYAGDASSQDYPDVNQSDNELDYYDIANAIVKIPDYIDNEIRFGDEYYYYELISVYLNDERLEYGHDYRIEYSTHSPGPGRTGTYKVWGVGDYHGEQIISRTITVNFQDEYYKNNLFVFENLKTKEDIDGGYTYLRYELPSYTYSGKAYEPQKVRVAWECKYRAYDDIEYSRGSSVLTIKSNGTIMHDLLSELREGIDYRVLRVEDNVEAGKAKVILEGMGYYSGTLIGTFTIEPKKPTITLTKQREFEVGEKTNLNVKSDSGGNVTYWCNDTSVATVDKDGNLTAKKEGYADIWIEVESTKNYSYGSIDISIDVVPAEASWSGASKMPVSSTATYTVKNGSIRVKKGSESILSVNGKTVKAKKAGAGYLELLDSDKKVTKTKKVTVYSIASGSYEMQSCIDSNLVLDIQRKSKENSARMLVYTRNDGKNQRYQFKLQSDGSYEIVCVHSGKCVDVQGGGTKKSQPVIQYTWKKGANQKWKITVDSKNRVTFVNVKSGMCFDIQGGKAKQGAKMIQYPSNGGNNQKWILNKK